MRSKNWRCRAGEIALADSRQRQPNQVVSAPLLLLHRTWYQRSNSDYAVIT